MEAPIALSEAARRLGVSRVTVWRMVQRGELVAYKIGGRWITTEADVKRYVEQARNVPAKDGDSGQ